MRNYFSIFGQEPTFWIDKPTLRKKYLSLLKELQSSHQIEELSELHLAYKTLSDDELRLEYLMKLQNLIHTEESNLHSNLSQEFLMEMMELNEAIESKDAEAFQKAENLLKQNWDNILDILRASPHSELPERIVNHYYERKYLKRLLKL